MVYFCVYGEYYSMQRDAALALARRLLETGADYDGVVFEVEAARRLKRKPSTGWIHRPLDWDAADWQQVIDLA